MLLKMKEVNRLRVLQGFIDGKILIKEAVKIVKRPLSIRERSFIPSALMELSIF